MKCHLAALLAQHVALHTAEVHWGNIKLHLKSKDFACDVQYAKLKQLFGTNTCPAMSPASHGGNARACRHSYHVLWIRKPLLRDGEDHQHRQQSLGWSRCINSSPQGITRSVSCGMCCSQEAKQIVCG